MRLSRVPFKATFLLVKLVLLPTGERLPTFRALTRQRTEHSVSRRTCDTRIDGPCRGHRVCIDSVSRSPLMSTRRSEISLLCATPSSSVDTVHSSVFEAYRKVDFFLGCVGREQQYVCGHHSTNSFGHSCSHTEIRFFCKLFSVLLSGYMYSCPS